MTNQQLCHTVGHPAEAIETFTTKVNGKKQRISRCKICGQTSQSGKLKLRDWKDEKTNQLEVLAHVDNELSTD